ncbi:MSMEG_1061 family FMN-dependent PPOX-type flavoprotein [Streptomyces calidiresistens]|uniref:Pyridoxamine 5'-phosphate oxidase family protein n=1 Tax=Streptomyces calidiresistens TaxID=1485586 RepID=A0A7W3T2I2_9ACTN|nr:pyridoxamine 5'-phosphate oxidase family protein [Streptomyces calidiresistens]
MGSTGDEGVTGPGPLTAAVTVDSAEELREIVGEPVAHARNKVRTSLHALDRAWLEHAPLCLLATADEEGNCDVSPRGDPGRCVLVLDDRTLALPDRPGNKRVDSLRNILVNPRVGLIFLIPGRGDTLRVNGRARIVREAPFMDRMTVRGHRPRLAVLVEVEEVYHHCSKAFLRSRAWEPGSWEPGALPSRARIAKALDRPDDSLEELEEYYGPSYAERLYG